MKIQPLTTPYAFSRLFFGPKGSASAGPQSFTDLFLSAVIGSKSPHPFPTPAYANAAPPPLFPSSSAEVIQPASAPAPLAQDAALEDSGEDLFAEETSKAAQDSPPALEENSGPPSPRTEMFPLSGPRTVPPGYIPALIAHLSVDSETGEVQIRFQPTTTISEYTWLYLLDGVPLPSMLEQIRWQAAAQGISLADTPLTMVDTDLPPPFAGKSLEELSRIVLPGSFYYTNPGGPYGSIGGSLPSTTEQRAEAFALIDDYVVDLGGTA